MAISFLWSFGDKKGCEEEKHLKNLYGTQKSCIFATNKQIDVSIGK